MWTSIAICATAVASFSALRILVASELIYILYGMRLLFSDRCGIEKYSLEIYKDTVKKQPNLSKAK